MTLADTNVTKPWNRKKSTAVLLAIFFGPWTWLYTFRKDMWKFVFGVAFATPGALVALIVVLNGIFNRSAGEANLGLLLFGLSAWPFTIIIWLLAIIDVLIKKKQWYSQEVK